jgi:hypothetical protein
LAICSNILVAAHSSHLSIGQPSLVENRTDWDTKRRPGYSFASFVQNHPILKALETQAKAEDTCPTLGVA